MNPPACARRARDLLDRPACRDRGIAVVSGDDLMPRLDELLAEGSALTNLDTGEPLTAVRVAGGQRQCLPRRQADCRGPAPGGRRWWSQGAWPTPR